MTVINTALPASATYLNQSQEMLARSLSRLSSDSLAVTAPDDTSGLPPSDNFAAQARQAQAATAAVQNAVSYLQTADGFLSGVGKTLSRMGELSGLANDAAKSSSEVAPSQTEFQALQDQLRATIGAGTALFESGATGLAVPVPRPALSQAALQGIISQQTPGAYDLSLTNPGAGAQLADVLQQVAAQRVTLGAAQSQLQLTAATLMIGQANLGAAFSGLSGAAAAASTQFVSYNLLTQPSTAMEAQANLEPTTVLRLL